MVMQPGRRGIHGDGKKPVTMTQALQGQRGALAATARPPARRQVMERIAPRPTGAVGSIRTRPGHPQNQVSATAQSRKKTTTTKKTGPGTPRKRWLLMALSSVLMKTITCGE